jgi:hypothetical protein
MTTGIDDEDADDIERGDEHGDDGGGASLIWGGTDLDACAVTSSPDVFRWYIIDGILRQHFGVGGYEAHRSNCGQTNSAGCMGFNTSMSGLYGYRLHVTGYEEIRDDFLSYIEDPSYTGCNDTDMEIPVNRLNLTAAVPSPEWQNIICFERSSGICGRGNCVEFEDKVHR